MEFNCPECKNSVQDSWVACPFCSIDLSKILRCTNCAEIIDEKWMACPFCGARKDNPDQNQKDDPEIASQSNQSSAQMGDVVGNRGTINTTVKNDSRIETNIRNVDSHDTNIGEQINVGNGNLTYTRNTIETQISGVEQLTIHQGEDKTEENDYKKIILEYLNRLGPTALKSQHRQLLEIQRGYKKVESHQFAAIEEEVMEVFKKRFERERYDKRYRLRDPGGKIINERMLDLDQIVNLINNNKYVNDIPQVDINESEDWSSAWARWEIFEHRDLQFYCHGTGSKIDRNLVFLCKSCKNIYDKAFLRKQKDEICQKCNTEVQSKFNNEKLLSYNEIHNIIDTCKWAVISPGSFIMGSPVSDINRDQEEIQHTVKLTEPFLVLKTPVDLILYNSIPGYSNPGKSDFPVNYVSWFDAIKFCNDLSELLGLPVCYEKDEETQEVKWNRKKQGVRLLTEAEWEYACRAGSDSIVYQSKDNDIYSIAWFDEDELHEVADHEPNKYGLFDMLGLVSEWVWDSRYEYDTESVEDPSNDSEGSMKILRGGSFKDDEEDIRCAKRFYETASLRSSKIGFRVAISLNGEPLRNNT